MDERVRTPLIFECEGMALAATLDRGDRATGLLVVTGGAQVRAGPHRWQADLAQQLASEGFPVFRFDRRGIGDSDGQDEGFLRSGPDIEAAAREFQRLCPALDRLIGLGLCDGATALALHHRAAGIERLLLANPWVVDPYPGLPPRAALRRHYGRRLVSPHAWRRLLTGGLDIGKAAKGLTAAVSPEADTLARRTAAALLEGSGETRFLLATGDATAIAFADHYAGPAFAALRRSGRADVIERDTASHSFAYPGDREWLSETVLAELRRIDAEG